MACSNRVGTEAPWNIGRVLRVVATSSIRAAASSPPAREDQDELVTAELDLDMIEEVRRTWQFYRDRRPESYGAMAEPLP